LESLESLFDLLLPGQKLLSMFRHAAYALGMQFVLLRAWSNATSSLHLLWAATSRGAVLVDPHLVDYDLTLLVPAGVLAAILVPHLRWPPGYWVAAATPGPTAP
jgi:hypothetical protein